MTDPTQRLARRLGCTDGQAYTIVIGLVAAVVLLAFGLPGTFGAPDRAAAENDFAVSVTTPPTSSAPTTTEVVDPTTTFPPRETVPPTTPPSSVTAPFGSTAPPTTGSPVPIEPTFPPDDSPPPTSTCPASDGLAPLMEVLASTGIVPDQSITLLVSRLSGCSATDPVVLLLGTVAELGSGLPDLGLDIPILELPFIEIPLDIVDAVQPLRDAIDPLCDTIGTVSQVIIRGFGTWPAGVGAFLGTPITQVLLACGQLRPA